MTIYIIFIVITIVLLSWWLYTKTRLSKKEREVIQGCIKHYEAVIQIAEVSDDWFTIMENNKVHAGLCRYLDRNRVPINLQKWVKRVSLMYGDFGMGCKFWYKIPAHCTKSYEAIEALQYRVDRMKELLVKY